MSAIHRTRCWRSLIGSAIRVLALEGFRFSKRSHILECLGNLLHLRYLKIRDLLIDKVPEEIGALRFLQTLDLELYGILELPHSIGMLTELVCLRAQHIYAPDGVIGRLTSLEELQIGGPLLNDDSQRQFAKDLGNLCELRVLRINSSMNEDAQTDLMHTLGNLQKMQHLTLDCSVNMNAWDAAVPSCDLRCLFLPDIIFPKLPLLINSAHLPSLSHLEICVGDVDEQGLKALGGLPELCYISLHSMATITSSYTKAGGCFQKLKSLVLPYSMVQFVANEDLSASFTICYKSKGMVTGSRKRVDCRQLVPAVVMPNLEELAFDVSVNELVQNKFFSFGDLGLEYLPSIRRIKVDLWCDDAFEDDVEREAAALRRAIQVHPNCPARTPNSILA